MKLAAPIALVLLAATAFAAAAAGRDAAGPTPARCGGELWRLKTLSDPGRNAVQLEATDTTIAAIGKRPYPRPVPRLRRTAFQRHAWQVVAQITKYRVETDGIRLELYDHGSYLHAVIPTPDCLSVVTRARKDIATTFNLFAVGMRDLHEGLAIARSDRLRTRHRFLEPASRAARRGPQRRRATSRDGAPHCRRLLARAPGRHRVGARRGQLEPEGGALPGLALEPDVAPMRLDDLTREDETESGARDAELPAHVATEELREDLLLVSSGNAEPFVSHPDPGLIADRRCAHLDDSAVGRILDRVREKVADHLGEAVAIAADGERLTGRLELQFVRIALG